MPAQRKVFRIEESLRLDCRTAIPPALEDDAATLRHHELLAHFSALRELLDRHALAPQPDGRANLDTVVQGRELKHELDLIHEAIRRTKREVGGLDLGGFIGPQMTCVGRELDAVIAGTEQATQNILKCAEDIDQLANTLSSLLKDGYAQGLAQDMRDHVVKIFEACNFQDLTGQRINKVVTTLKFIEDHINRMQAIWSSIENAVPTAPSAPQISLDRKFLNGPKLPDESGHSSQAEIDLIFDSN